MKTPIFIVEARGLSIHDDVEEVELHLEAEASLSQLEEVAIYDASGIRLTTAVQGNVMRLSVPSDADDRESELTTILREYLALQISNGNWHSQACLKESTPLEVLVREALAVEHVKQVSCDAGWTALVGVLAVAAILALLSRIVLH